MQAIVRKLRDRLAWPWASKDISSSRTGSSKNDAPITLILHWLGIGDIIVCGAILRGLRLQFPDLEINFKLQSNEDVDAQRFVAWARLVWPTVSVNHDQETPGQVWEIGRPGDPEADPEMRGIPGLRHDLWAELCETSAVGYHIRPTSSGLKKAKEILNSMGVKTDQPIYYLSPVTANRWRNWPIEKWRELEIELSKMSVQVAIGALKPEPWATEEQLAEFSTPFFIGQHEPDVLLGILACMDCIISNDSGFAHLGGILGEHTVAVCGGNYDGYACFGWYNSVQVVQASSRNIDDVEVEEVLNAIQTRTQVT